MNTKYILIFIIIFVLIIYFITRKSNKFKKTIFIFWDKGWKNAPKLCKLCLESWYHFNPEWRIIKLDKKNVYKYLDSDFLNKVWEKELVQHQADIIRVNLLRKYGGVWVDATTFCNKPLDSWLFRYMKNGFFCFKYNEDSGLQDYKLGNWFLASTHDSYIINKFTSKYNNYWDNKIVDQYWGFNFLFHNLCKTDKIFNKMYNSINFFDARIIRVQEPKFYNTIFDLEKPVTEEVKKIISKKNIPLYKLTYKNTTNNFKQDSTFMYLKKNKLKI